MGDARFERPYAELRRSPDPAAMLRRMSDEDVVAALASASRHHDPYLANTLATEALNRVHRLRAAARNLGEGVLTLDLDGVITFANPMAARLLGLPRDELVGAPVREATGLQDTTGLDAALRAQTQTNEDARMRRADGAWFPVACTTAPIFSTIDGEGPAGEVEGVVLAFADITARKRAEAETRLRSTMLGALGEAVAASDLEGRISFWNPAAEALFGWSAEEAHGRWAIDLLVAPEERERAMGILASAQAGESWTGVLLVVRKDGARRHAAVTIAPTRDERGELIALVAVATDITDRRRAEEETRLRSAILDSVGEAVTALDEEDRYVYWNAAAERLTGWRRDEVLGRTPREIIVSPWSQEAASAIAIQLRRGEPWAGQGPIRRKDGTSFTAKATATPVRDREGHVYRIVGTWTDISDQVRAREEVEDARAFLQATLDELTYQIAILDERGVIVAVNRAWREFGDANGLAMSAYGVGASYLDVCERAAAMGVPEARLDAEGIRAVFRGEAREYTREYPCHSPEEKRWFTMHVRAFHDRHERPYAVVSHANVTAIRQARTLGHVLEVVVQQSGVASFVTTLDGETLVWNEQATSLFGYTARETLGRPVDRILDGTAEHDKDEIRGRIDRGQTVRLPRARCRGADGRDVVVDLTLTPVRDREGQIVAVSALAKPAAAPKWD